AVLLSGCASSEHISLMAAPSQQSMTRDGVPALLSTQRQLVMLRPVQASVRRGDRPAFVVAVYNRGRTPTDLLVRNISATSSEGSAIHVFGYDELVVEAQRKQRWATVAVALSGAAGAINAANAGYTHTYGTYSGYSNGTYGGALTGTTMGTY